MLAPKLLSLFSLWPLLLLPLVRSQNVTGDHEFNTRRTLSIGYVIFPGFEPLDVYGPLEILYSLSAFYKMTLSFISFNTGPINARLVPHSAGGTVGDFGYTLGPATTATHTFADAPALDVIFVPGGTGSVRLEQNNNTEIEEFLVRRFEQADYILSISFGAVTLARSGLLNGRRATTNKSGWAWITDPKHGGNITWVPSARWTQDGKIWTSSGVAAGLDMTYAFLKHLYGTQALDLMTNVIEYAPHLDPNWDPFSVVHNVPGADSSRPLRDCVGPVGTTGNSSQGVTNSA